VTTPCQAQTYAITAPSFALRGGFRHEEAWGIALNAAPLQELLFDEVLLRCYRKTQV
jgi:hypothetical protein